MKPELAVSLAAVVLFAGCTGMREQRRLAERELLKMEIMEELRAERAPSPGTASLASRRAPPPTPAEVDVPASGRTDPLNSPPAAMAKLPASSAPLAFQPTPGLETGSVEGRLLRGGKGSTSTRVRLVRMEVFRTQRSANYRAQDYHDTQTDADGRYRFTSVEPGNYKLLWVPPGADYWVRRLADRPDVTVTENRTADVPSIETKRKLLAN